MALPLNIASESLLDWVIDQSIKRSSVHAYFTLDVFKHRMSKFEQRLRLCFLFQRRISKQPSMAIDHSRFINHLSLVYIQCYFVCIPEKLIGNAYVAIVGSDGSTICQSGESPDPRLTSIRY